MTTLVMQFVTLGIATAGVAALTYAGYRGVLWGIAQSTPWGWAVAATVGMLALVGGIASLVGVVGTLGAFGECVGTLTYRLFRRKKTGDP